MVFAKKNALEYDLFFNIWKDSISFFPKIWHFSLGGNWKMMFFKQYMEIWFFQYICINVAKANIILSQKNMLKGDISGITGKCDIYPTKYDISVKKNILIDILDWCSRKSSHGSLCFYAYLYRRFCILFSSRKKTGNLIHKIETWLLLQFIWLEIFYNEESSILCTIQPSGVAFRDVL